MAEHITIATANTYFGSMLQDPTGLEPFVGREVDVVLMQEVLDMSVESVSEKLAHAGYSLGAFDVLSGLAIATRSRSNLEVYSTRTQTIEPVGKLGVFALKHDLPQAQRFRSRAFVTASVVTPGGSTLQVATAHPIVFARPLARKRQLWRMAEVTHQVRQPNVPLVLGADMNHYPGPRKIDSEFIADSGLRRVEFPEPTWLVTGSKHEWLARIAAVVSRKPLQEFDGQLDAMFYGDGIEAESVEVVDIKSDHKAIVTSFTFDHDNM